MAIEKDKLNEFIEKMKAEVKELGLDIEEKLEDAKNKWAETATTDLFGGSSVRPRVCSSALASAI